MNPFQAVINDLQLTPESQGTNHEYGWLYLLLSYAAERQVANPQANTHANPYKEVLLRVKPFTKTFAGQRLAQMLSDGATK